MNWSEPLNLYCERLGPGLWAEPLNAVSNAAFFIAAASAFLLWRRAGGRDTPALLLILVTVAIAIGSTIFHTVATRGAILLDIIPIAIFLAGYLVLVWRRYLKFGMVSAITALAIFEVISFTLPSVTPPGLLNRSVPYLPALLMLIVVAAMVQGKTRANSREAATSHWLWIAAGLFTASFFLRSIDIAVCRFFPFGTHFIWHCLNATVLYVLLRAAIEWPGRGASARVSRSPKWRRKR
jgi:Ceramidase